jgi:hypothetical protein
MTACHLWPGARTGDGYAERKVRGRVVYVHREVLERKLGRRIRRDRECAHLCHVRHCVNPAHLIETTHRANCRMLNPHRVRAPESHDQRKARS